MAADTTAHSAARPAMPKSPPPKTRAAIPRRSLGVEELGPSSMMTKRNRMMMAPAYTMSWMAARNCACSARKSPATLRMRRRSPIALRIGFLETTTPSAPASARSAQA